MSNKNLMVILVVLLASGGAYLYKQEYVYGVVLLIAGLILGIIIKRRKK